VRSVHSITANTELERFFDALYGEQTGYVYSPTKNPETQAFEQYFFQWPEDKAPLIKHVTAKAPTHEVYYAPALLNAQKAEKENFKGANYVWCEFDGNVPTNIDVPEPSIKIRSSVDGHEHWYWKLEGFVDNLEVFESISQRLTYHLNADVGCWDATRVLRPPSTLHHESNNLTVILRFDTDRVTPIGSFATLPELPVKLLGVSDINFVPQIFDVIAKYPWSTENLDFFKTKEIEKGKRSHAMAKIGHICMEMGMTNAEVLSVLFNVDLRWGKFQGRRDQKKQLLGIINYCRTRHPSVDPAKETESAESTGTLNTLVKPDRLQIFTIDKFLAQEIKLEWIIENLIHHKGFFLVSGPPAVGKSQLCIRLCEKIARGEKILKWKAVRPLRALFVSMEMPDVELKYIIDQMRLDLTNEHLIENFMVMPIGASVGLTNAKSQDALTKKVIEYKPDVIIFDSLGIAVGEDLTSETTIFKTFGYIDEVLRGQLGCSVGFIHHNRKAQVGNKKPSKLDDLYGSQYIGAGITTAIGLWPMGKETEVSCLKLRMAEAFATFRMRRIPGIDFEIPPNSVVRDTPIFGGLVTEETTEMPSGGWGDTI
jgi:hypothetical protein